MSSQSSQHGLQKAEDGQWVCHCNTRTSHQNCEQLILFPGHGLTLPQLSIKTTIGRGNLQQGEVDWHHD